MNTLHHARLALALGLAGCFSNDPTSDVSVGEPTLYERVTSSGALRCGYVVYHPGSIKDPNTGKLSGVFVDTIEEAAKNLGLTVQWTEEVGWGTMIEGLQAGRYDMICSPVWANSTRAKLVDFSTPLFFSGIGAYVRSDDDRFTTLASMADGSASIVTIDGEMSDIIARSDYPSARRVSLPQASDVSQALLNVIEGKADVAFVEPAIAAEFIRQNPDRLKNIAGDDPVRVFANSYMFARGQDEFRQMLDRALDELVNGGFVERKIQEYEPFPGSLYRVARPYRSHSVPAAQ